MKSFSPNGLEKLKTKLNSEDCDKNSIESYSDKDKIDSSKLLAEIENIANSKVSLYEGHDEYEFSDAARIAEEYLLERTKINEVKTNHLRYDFKIYKN